ncbi:MAG: hypothetical protein NWE89_17285 [Candidatus Bathyarchaeota archaeon]|nr:hypothetical protein [Candidatus Bathyarchaeota archaeon]
MNQNRLMSWIILGSLIVGTIAYFATQNAGYEPMGIGRGIHREPGDLEIYYSMKAVLSSVNAFLLSIILLIYIRVYNDTGLNFSLGLVIFSVALLLYAITSNPLLVRVAGFMGQGLGPFAMLPDLFTCIASFTLLYLSR